MRPTMSVLPPGDQGMMMRTGLSGHAALSAGVIQSVDSIEAASILEKPNFIFTIFFSSNTL